MSPKPAGLTDEDATPVLADGNGRAAELSDGDNGYPDANAGSDGATDPAGESAEASQTDGEDAHVYEIPADLAERLFEAEGTDDAAASEDQGLPLPDRSEDEEVTKLQTSEKDDTFYLYCIAAGALILMLLGGMTEGAYYIFERRRKL